MSIFVDICNKTTEICHEMGNDAPSLIILEMQLEKLSDEDREQFELERRYCSELADGGMNILDAWTATEERFGDSHAPRWL